MLQRFRPKDEVQLLATLRQNRASVILAFNLGFLIADFIDLAERMLHDRGRQLSPDQKRIWRYRLTRDFLIHIYRQEQQWLDEEGGAVTFWFWKRSPRAILNRKWSVVLSQTGPGGVRYSLKRFAVDFMRRYQPGLPNSHMTGTP